MMNKLLKHDLRKSFRVLVYIYAICIILSGITRFINIWQNIQAVFIIGQIFAGLTYSAIGSILVNTFVQILVTFNTSFYKDESYLTHTLPVKKSKLLLSKYLSSLIVILTSVVVVFASLFVLFYSHEFVLWLKYSIESVVANLNMSVGLCITMFIVIIFSQICATMSMAFTAIVKANTHNHHRVPKGLGWFALFYFGSMYCSVMVIAIIFAITGNISQLLATTMTQSAFILLIIMGLILYIAYTIIFYYICYKMFNKGVNVD